MLFITGKKKILISRFCLLPPYGVSVSHTNTHWPTGLTNHVHQTIPDIPSVQQGMHMPTQCLHAIVILSHSSRQTEDVGNSGEERESERGPHLRDHLYFIDLSISVSVHGWEVGEQSCLLGLLACLCLACTIHPLTFSLPVLPHDTQ